MDCSIPENQQFEFLTRSDTNQLVWSQKQARSMKFQIEEEEGLYYLWSENKGTDQLRSYCEDRFAVTAKLICAFVFAYANCWFSHGAVHIRFHINIPEEQDKKLFPS